MNFSSRKSESSVDWAGTCIGIRENIVSFCSLQLEREHSKFTGLFMLKMHGVVEFGKDWKSIVLGKITLSERFCRWLMILYTAIVKRIPLPPFFLSKLCGAQRICFYLSRGFLEQKVFWHSSHPHAHIDGRKLERSTRLDSESVIMVFLILLHTKLTICLLCMIQR